MRDALELSSERAIPQGGENGFPERTALLREAGFAEVGPLCRPGDDAVLVAPR